MKVSIRWLLLITIFIILLLVLFSYVKETFIKKLAPQTQVVNNVSLGLPIRLIIPAINVDANIQKVGVTPSGEMEVPNNTVDAGWFKLGTNPGEKGSAVIAGHFNGKSGESGVFRNLFKLKKGDNVHVETDEGNILTFVVRESRMYDQGYAEDVFISGSDGVYLNLITCDGVWDRIRQSYSKRLVVFSDIMQH